MPRNLDFFFPGGRGNVEGNIGKIQGNIGYLGIIESDMETTIMGHIGAI